MADEPMLPAAPPATTADSASDSNVSMESHSSNAGPDSFEKVNKEGGLECAVQTLYEGTPKCECCKNWVEEYPDDLRKAIEEEEQSRQKALVVRMRKNHGDGKALVLDSVVVQSESLKTTLGEVFEGYQGITPSLKKLVFKAPFHPFHYRWAKFKQIFERQKVQDADSASYTQLLYDVLHTELNETMAEIDDLVAHGVITYPFLWALFEPGTRVVAVQDRQPDRFFIASNHAYNYEKGFFDMAATFVDWDGSRFAYTKTRMAIGQFDGTKAITELNVMPATLYPSREAAEASAIARGRRFVELSGYHYMAYQGNFRFKAVDKYDVFQQDMARQVDGRIVVDAAAYFNNTFTPGQPPMFDPLRTIFATPSIEVEDDDHFDDYADWEPHPPPPVIRHRRMMTTRAPPPRGPRSGRGAPMHRGGPIIYGEPPKPWQKNYGQLIKPTEQKEEPDPDLTEAELLLCNTRVRGYSLKLKKWGEFEVDSISEIAWNDRAFPGLMLPSGYKDLILSFVEGQNSKKNTFDDIIEGKGLGLIMLLVGTAGTGKTLTAEAVADKVQKPLYMLGAGELGQTAELVEERLNRILQLTEKWGAVLLFDECDVFLQERSMDHLEHNEIVAVFLRVLEYYRGILFMTTNRAESIDRAFQSRVHLTLKYPDLQPFAKEHIWRQFMTQSGESSGLPDETFAHLAQLPLNGRQIKNVVKSAMLLATQQNQSVGLEQIQTVLRATGHGGGAWA
ncbi:ATPase [Diaporthe helianthi]|uniref:ATPase n=1 Tax=Diaporthe helianthi TaxID=158607 RepID=A0A2P5HVA3_DIAHE|nr:ATPase [Diaporthe helianthi]